MAAVVLAVVLAVVFAVDFDYIVALHKGELRHKVQGRDPNRNQVPNALIWL